MTPWKSPRVACVSQKMESQMAKVFHILSFTILPISFYFKTITDYQVSINTCNYFRQGAHKYELQFDQDPSMTVPACWYSWNCPWSIFGESVLISFHQIRKSAYINIIPSTHFHFQTNLLQLFQLYNSKCVGIHYLWDVFYKIEVLIVYYRSRHCPELVDNCHKLILAVDITAYISKLSLSTTVTILNGVTAGFLCSVIWCAGNCLTLHLESKVYVNLCRVRELRQPSACEKGIESFSVISL